MKSNPNAFYKYVNKLKNVATKIGPFIDPLGKQIEASEAESLNQQFTKVFSLPNKEMIISDPDQFFGIARESSPGSPGALGGGKSPSQPPGGPGGTPTEVPAEDTVTDIRISHTDIRAAMNDQSAHSCPGPDGIPGILIKKCLPELQDQLLQLFQHSLDTGDVPALFRSAFVKPALKSGKSKALPSSYRPLSMTSVLSKCLERIIRKVLQEHLERNGLLSDSQHGFRKGRSCLTQLLDHYDRVLKALEDGGNCDAVYLDFAKAFDKVDIAILMRRLKEKNITGTIARWIHAWLTGRTQHVIANGDISSPSQVTSGVPQGSVLGPLLFLVMIDSITACGTSSWISIFADDSRLANVVKSTADAEAIQEDLEKIYSWQKTSNTEFNADKFEVLQYGLMHDLKTTYNYLTSDAANIIEAKDATKDLGVIMAASGKFDLHITAVANKVRGLMGWFRRTFICRKFHFMKFFWTTYIVPHLDYASQLWSPGMESPNLQKLEGLLRTFSTWFPGTNGMNYWERLRYLKMYSIQRRFERYKTLFTWKILEGRVPNCGLTWKNSPLVGRLCTIPQTKQSSSIQTLRSNSFQAVGPRLFNSFPISI
jgi:hypothetical protein